MLEVLFTSKTRAKMLIKFFLVDDNDGYLRGLEKELHEGSNAVRLELNRFAEAGLLISTLKGNRRVYMANKKHPLYKTIKTFVYNIVGVDRIVEHVASRVGDLEKAYITGNFAIGVDSDTIELALVGNDPDTEYINQLVKKAEKIINRKIMYLVVSPAQMEYFFKDKPTFLIWEKDS